MKDERSEAQRRWDMQQATSNCKIEGYEPNAESQARERVPANDAISVVESRRRERAVNFARASVGLEGFKPEKEDEAHARRFINGEIDLAAFVKVDRVAQP